MERLQLLPSATRLQRDRHSVQVGLTPGRALVLESPRHPPSRVLALLDGTRSEPVVQHEASRLGMPPQETAKLLGALREHGLLHTTGSLLPSKLPPATRRRLEPEAAALALRELPDGANPARILHDRRQRRVIVAGHSRLSGPLASLLAASGVGHVHPTASGTVVGSDPTVGGVLPGDARRPFRRAACDAVLRAAPETDTRAIPEREADLVVLLGRPRPTPPEMLAHMLRSVRHLTVWVRDGTVVIGPLVRPGSTACLRCFDLHRTDRDPHWPVLIAQLSTMPDPAESAEATLLAMAAAIAAGQVLAELDGDDPDTLDGTLEVSPPATIRRRSWVPHPRCGCLGGHRRRRR
jgi:bacteriocin biosynthesis cyclodehydratase domain-containing protein